MAKTVGQRSSEMEKSSNPEAGSLSWTLKSPMVVAGPPCVLHMLTSPGNTYLSVRPQGSLWWWAGRGELVAAHTGRGLGNVSIVERDSV